MLRNLMTKRIAHIGDHRGLNNNSLNQCQLNMQTIRNNSDSINMASPWKEASSVIIVAKSSLQESMGTNLSDLLTRHAKTSTNILRKYDYRLLMLKRSASSSFMANAYVFPGGTVELLDYSSKWWNVFDNAGISRELLMQLSKSIHGPRPPMFTASVTLPNTENSVESYFPAELALRISAIRETFEETGLLLLTSFDCQDENSSLHCASFNMDKEMWRKKIRKDPNAFIDMCLEAKLCPHIWCLHEWWNWLTPSIGHRRFDTMFYICCLPKLPEIKPDQAEITVTKWYTPDEILKEMAIGNLLLPPPQVYEISRLLNFYHFQDLQKFAKQRECKGIERWMGIISSAADGAIAFYPGDGLYPEKYDPKALFSNPKYPYTISYLRSATHNLNRIEIDGKVTKICCNIVASCGHVQPLTHPSESHMVHSQL